MIINTNKIIFYYSGHSNETHLILPQDELRKDLLVKAFLDFSIENSEILFLTDCCHGGLKINYKLENKLFRLQMKHTYFTSSRFISISSTDDDDITETNTSGSKYTSIITRLLKYGKNNVISSIRYECPKTIVHLSHPNIEDIWPWCLKKVNADVSIADDINCILIRR